MSTFTAPREVPWLVDRSTRDPACAAALAAGVAVLRIDRPIALAGWYGANVPEICGCLAWAAAAPTVRTVLLDLDSPGGTLAGLSDLHASARALRASGKRLVAVAHDSAMSIAYALAALADEVVATPTSRLGSVGVIFPLLDESRMMRDEGIRPAHVAWPRGKADRYPGMELTADALSDLEAQAREQFGRMAGYIRERRPRLTEESLLALDAAELAPDAALAAGLCDRVLPYADLLAELTGQARPRALTTTPIHHAPFPAPGARAMSETNPTAPANPQNPAGGGAPPMAISTVAQLRAAYPELTAAAISEAAKEPPATLAQLRAELPGEANAALCLAALESGLTLSQVREKQTAALAADVARLTTELAAAKAEAAKAKAAAGLGSDPVSAGSDDKPDNTFLALVRSKLAAGKVEGKTKQERTAIAMGEVAREHREAHKAWLDAGCPSN